MAGMSKDGIPYGVAETILGEADAFTHWARLGKAGSIFSLVRTDCRQAEGWVAARTRDTSVLLGRKHNAGWMSSCLRELGARGMLLRDPPWGQRTGRGGAMYLPNLWLPDWREDVWKLEKAVALRLLGFRRGGGTWEMARPYSAPFPGFLARCYSAPKRRGAEHLWRVPYGAPKTEAFGAALGRAISSPNGAALRTAPIAERARGAHLSSVPEGTISLGSEGEIELTKAKQAVMEAAAPNPKGQQGVWGASLTALTEIVRQHPVDKLLRVLPYRDRSLMVPSLIKWLGEQAALGYPALPAVDELQRQVEQHERMATVMSANDDLERAQWHEDQAAAFRHELDAMCDTRLMEDVG